MWGKQGFTHTQVAWYRRDFALPAQSALSQGEELLLSGSSLADRGIIYLNGKKIYTTHAWNESFDLNIGSKVHWGGKNDLAIRIENHTFRSGHYLGGIRGSIAVKIGMPPRPQPMSAGQMATWLWTKAIHGCAGSVISYFYNNAAFKGYYPPFSPFYRKPEALKAVASIHKLINELAPLVLTGPVRGRVALVYPMTSLRAHIPQDYEQFISGPMTKQLARYYGALLFNMSRSTWSSTRICPISSAIRRSLWPLSPGQR